MLLNSMTVDCKAPAVAPPAAFLQVINQKSVARVKEEIEALLSLEDCICDVSLRFAAALQNGDFIVLNSDDPGKLSIFP